MGNCGKLLGKGAVVWPCLLDSLHHGPCVANEYAPSVAARRAWDAQHHVAVAEQPALWDEPVAEPLTDRERRHVSARAALDDLQGQPQTFWERNGVGDEYPLPSSLAAAVVAPEPPSFASVASEGASAVADSPDAIVPAEPHEVAAFMASSVVDSVQRASMAFADGDVGLGLYMVGIARSSLEAISNVLGRSE